VGNCIAIAVAPANSNIVYAGGKSSNGQPWLFKTMDAGVTWDTLTALGTDTTLLILAVHPVDANIVFAGLAGGVFKSTDGGNSWTPTGLVNVRAIAIDPAAPETVYAGTANGVYVSVSGGGGWTLMNDGLEWPSITGLTISTDHYLHASTYGAGMYRWRITTGINEQFTNGESAALKAFPNPARGRVTFSIRQAAAKIGGAERVELRVYDANGRLIRSFPMRYAFNPIASVITWDGTDQNGNAIPAGVYFYRLSSGDSLSVKTLIFIK